TKKKLAARLDEIVAEGRQPFSRHVHLTTYTLVFPKVEWLLIREMEKQWERADIDASLSDDGDMTVKTSNVTAFWIDIPNAQPQVRRVIVDGETIRNLSGTSLDALLAKEKGEWMTVPQDRKKPGDPVLDK